MIALWVATVYLLKNAKKAWLSLMTALPASFMSAVSLTYILLADEGLRLSSSVGYPAGIGFALVLFGLYCWKLVRTLNHSEGKKE